MSPAARSKPSGRMPKRRPKSPKPRRKEAEDDRERRAGARDRRDRPQRRPGLGAPAEQRARAAQGRHRSRCRPPSAEEHREEDGHERRRVDAPVARQRQHRGDHLERAKQRRVASARPARRRALHASVRDLLDQHVGTQQFARRAATTASPRVPATSPRARTGSWPAITLSLARAESAIDREPLAQAAERVLVSAFELRRAAPRCRASRCGQRCELALQRRASRAAGSSRRGPLARGSSCTRDSIAAAHRVGDGLGERSSSTAVSPPEMGG